MWCLASSHPKGLLNPLNGMHVLFPCIHRRIIRYGPSCWVEYSPEIHIVKRLTGEIIRADALPIHCFERCGPQSYIFRTSYKLRSSMNNFRNWLLRDVTTIRGGTRGLAPVMYIASPTVSAFMKQSPWLGRLTLQQTASSRM